MKAEKRNSGLKVFSRNKELFFLALPSVIFIFIFKYIPMYGLILPFKNYIPRLGIFGSPWTGFQNFGYLFMSDDAFRITRNTLVMNALFILFGTLLAVIFAIILNEMSKRAVKFYQTVLFLPYFISWIVASYIFYALLDMDYGFINVILGFMGHGPILWYNDPSYWPVILIMASMWKNVGYNTLIYYTGLLSIDKELIEAADIDGANKRQQIIYITIPMLKSLIVIMTLLAIGGIFYSDFGLFYNVTLDSAFLYPVTDVIDTYVYRALRATGDIGMASAAGLYQSLAGFILVLVTNFIVRRISKENALF